jgi:hypothetical protein
MVPRDLFDTEQLEPHKSRRYGPRGDPKLALRKSLAQVARQYTDQFGWDKSTEKIENLGVVDLCCGFPPA